MLVRDVFYIPGYDPKGQRYYYSLLKNGFNAYAKNFNIKADLSKLNMNEKIHFCEFNGENFKTKYSFLLWNDIVKKYWNNNFKSALIDVFIFFRIYFITGLFLKFGKHSPYQLITGFYPPIFMILSLFLICFCGVFTFFILKIYIHFSLALISALIIVFLMYKLTSYLGKKLAVYWLLRLIVFCALWQDRKKGALDEIIKAFSQTLFNALNKHKDDENYELILIAHSVGTICCIEVLYKLLKLCKVANLNTDKLKIITLGECIPLLSYQQKAKNFKEKLEFIFAFNLKWYDYTSIIDGACFPSIDFVGTSDVKTEFKPKFLSARFHTLYEKDEYAKIKKDKYKAHFLYLYDIKIKSGSYDFFDFILGENLLERKIIKE
ncbi:MULTISPECIES: DUF829 domain-containing protein [unclassified Campylobacter]|uniref:DUF829 domain-containing protein n=1 Tax=unclassified Campylobacter TaxID=2593542 RepID=UPI001237C47C|nr:MULTISPECIES: DUF829 domain-containing protein [unclassified Campylobacter]KAA6225196.1 DUF829 domain-containing protein [Campylobacter sp. LR196d]KAA6228991.1 DUF829 domain-containing protein [Campylobacter sp. LR286c]